MESCLIATGALGADEWLLVQKLVPKRFVAIVSTLTGGRSVARSE